MTATDGSTVDDGAGDGVLVTGETELLVPPEPTDLDGFDLEREEAVIDCSTGEREDATWVGIRVGTLLDRTGAVADATHLLVTGSDGYRVCVPLVAALDALLAVEREGADGSSLPRFVGTGVEGTRSVKDVRHIETLSLGPGEDPADYEQSPDEST